MDLSIILETVTVTSLYYFFAGSIVGYFLRVNLSRFNGKRPGRYASKKTELPDKRMAVMTEFNEPPFELPDAVLKTLSTRRLGSVSVDPIGNEFQ